MSKFARGGGRGKRTAAAGLVISGMVISASMAPVTAQAAVPVFPDNITIFPDRDFVSIDGFSGHAGEQVTVEVRRPGIGVVGSATGTTAGTTTTAAARTEATTTADGSGPRSRQTDGSTRLGRRQTGWVDLARVGKRSAWGAVAFLRR
ncbi:hypothetical protein [Streptomyces kebangsaanensis]|uniref:hypothetical protein n=1 Tax=Streptomyces kebangsaanensis TaxID=864058 RepID=UPI00093C7D87|nr:hypothetical protein [Streptomyces kebangsaanensis]